MLSERETFVDSITERETQDASSKDSAVITVRIKRVERVGGRPPNPLQKIPTKRGNRKIADLCVGCVVFVNSDRT
jgi:hypothetical protein